jgi:hypothetical protein
MKLRPSAVAAVGDIASFQPEVLAGRDATDVEAIMVGRAAQLSVGRAGWQLAHRFDNQTAPHKHVAWRQLVAKRRVQRDENMQIPVLLLVNRFDHAGYPDAPGTNHQPARAVDVLILIGGVAWCGSREHQRLGRVRRR